MPGVVVVGLAADGLAAGRAVRREAVQVVKLAVAAQLQADIGLAAGGIGGRQDVLRGGRAGLEPGGDRVIGLRKVQAVQHGSAICAIELQGATELAGLPGRRAGGPAAGGVVPPAGGIDEGARTGGLVQVQAEHGTRQAGRILGHTLQGNGVGNDVGGNSVCVQFGAGGTGVQLEGGQSRRGLVAHVVGGFHGEGVNAGGVGLVERIFDGPLAARNRRLLRRLAGGLAIRVHQAHPHAVGDQPTAGHAAA